MKDKVYISIIAVLLAVVGYLVFNTGRYTLVNGPLASVYVLDSRTGRIWIRQGDQSLYLGSLDTQRPKKIEPPKTVSSVEKTPVAESGSKWWEKCPIVESDSNWWENDIEADSTP